MLTVLLLATHVMAVDDLAPRMAALQKFWERLDAIEVTKDFEQDKAAGLAEMKKRLDVGVQTGDEYNALYHALDDLRTSLLEHAAEKPSRTEGEFREAKDTWLVKTAALELEIARADLRMTVKTPKAVWSFAPSDDNDVKLMKGAHFGLLAAKNVTCEPFNTGYSAGMTLSFSEFPDAPGLDLRLTANLIGNEIVFEIAAPGDVSNLELLLWPKPLVTENTDKDFAVIPHMQGMLLPGNWDQPINEADLSNSRSLYMPWWGQIRDGRGVLTILETSDDAGAAYRHPKGGPTTIQPRWYASLGRLAYLRTARYVFDDEATYVTFAKRYRRFVKEGGRFVSLDEKRVRTPNVNEVIGRPVVHLGALYHFVKESALANKEKIEANHSLQTFMELAEQLRQLKAKGIDDAYVHLDGWGFYGYDNGHPDVLPAGSEQGGWEGLRQFAATCEELGYLFAVHDQYRDFYKSAVSFDPALATVRPDGSIPMEGTWCGGPQSILSARFAPEYVRRNHDLFAANGVKVMGAYLDVFSVVPLEESFAPAHPMTRSECARYRRECFSLLRARGYVISSEEPADYLVPWLDLVHHGPYATMPHIGGGGPRGIPVPLFNLVYHDSLLLPWEMGEDGGWGIPKGDAGRLHCLLNAGLPYVGPGADAMMIGQVKEACALSSRCATLEMTNHEFLDATWRKQRSTFSDGTRVTIDLDTKTHTIEYGMETK